MLVRLPLCHMSSQLRALTGEDGGVGPVGSITGPKLPKGSTTGLPAHKI